jgi:hypothetical protein
MDIDKFNKILKQRAGDNCFVVRMCEDDYAIVSDGKYEYRIKTKWGNPINLGAKSSNMTLESKIKRFNEKCTHDVIVDNFFTKDNDNEYVHMVHTPTGYSEDRIARLVNVEKHCRKVWLNTRKTETFIEQSIEKFKDNILYDKTVYVDTKTKLIVTCKKHGDISVFPRDFLNSWHGCPTCGKLKKNNVSKTAFRESCKNNTGYLYCIFCHDNTEAFIKIGITSKSNLKERFHGERTLPYKYKTLEIIKSHPDIIFFMEDLLHRKYKELKYVPLKKFAGSGECFKLWVSSIVYDCCKLMRKLAVELPESKKFAYLKTPSD